MESEWEASDYMNFMDLRWGLENQITCPHCGESERVEAMSVRGLFFCAACHRQFSATSGTALAYTKLGPTKLMGAIRLFRAGYNRRQAAQTLTVQYRTVFYLWPKIAKFLRECP